MYSRIAARALRNRPCALSSTAIPIPQARWIASSSPRLKDLHSKPPSSAKPLSNEGKSGLSQKVVHEYNRFQRQTGATGSSQTGSSKLAKDPVYSESQPEIDAQATPERNKRGSETEADDTTSEPLQPLPDLRQGIPSTFEAEFGKPNVKNPSRLASSTAESTAQEDINITEDPTKPNPPPGGGRGGQELPSSAYETSTDRRRNKLFTWSVLSFVAFAITGTAYYGRDWETEEEEKAHPEAPSGWDLNHFWKRIQARWSNQLSYYTEPTFPKLLPTMDPPPPYTLVLSLNDLLIHSEWTREHGWRTAKRPGLDYFLRYLCQYYEIVVFTDLPSQQADLIIKKLDPLRMIIMWPLFREATRYENGQYIKVYIHTNFLPHQMFSDTGM
jgi:mitochondrial import inner membrane translocase subunit TIM50